MHTQFISDLHLGPNSAATMEGFCRWLAEQQSSTEALYILGDLFDAWIGDDEDHPAAIFIQNQLRQFASKVPTFFIRGNRDFLIGKDFAAATGIELLDDFTVIDLYGTPTLLMHGDTLCTADQEYMQFRAMVRNPEWQQQILALPLAQRRVMAAQLREKSQSMNAIKAEDIMDVTEDEVVQALAKHQSQRLIHGHTHRPATHELVANGFPAKRYVLGDWHSTGWCIRADQNNIELMEFPLPI